MRERERYNPKQALQLIKHQHACMHAWMKNLIIHQGVDRIWQPDTKN